MTDAGLTPTDDDVNAVALAYWGPSEVYDRERLRAALAGFRRSEVPEPSAKDAEVTLTTEAVEANREYIERTAEPSDAQVRAAALAMYEWTNTLSMSGATTLARAALRAAGVVTR